MCIKHKSDLFFCKKKILCKIIIVNCVFFVNFMRFLATSIRFLKRNRMRGRNETDPKWIRNHNKGF